MFIIRRVFFVYSILMLLILLPAYSNASNSTKSNIGNNTEQAALSSDENKSQEVYTKIEDRANETFDYTPYLKKIWVVENWGGNHLSWISFCITKIENGKLEGIVSFSPYADPPMDSGPENFIDYKAYRDAIKKKGYNNYLEVDQKDFIQLERYYASLKPNLLGTVSGNVATFYYESFSSDFEGIRDIGTKANVKLLFKGNNTIEAAIEFTDRDGSNFRSCQFVYVPWNVSNERFFVEDKKMRVETDLNSWGKVHIVSGRHEVPASPGRSTRFTPRVFLTNEQGDILYGLGGYQTGLRVCEVQVEDLNGDGLLDVIVSIDSGSHEETLVPVYILKSIFYQLENGWFRFGGQTAVVNPKLGAIIAPTSFIPTRHIFKHEKDGSTYELLRVITGKKIITGYREGKAAISYGPTYQEIVYNFALELYDSGARKLRSINIGSHDKIIFYDVNMDGYTDLIVLDGSLKEPKELYIWDASSQNLFKMAFEEFDILSYFKMQHLILKWKEDILVKESE